jgi:DNA polymerase-3 subunit epsilon
MKHRWLAAKRWYLRKGDFDSPFRELLDATVPGATAKFAATEFVSLDIETTGLDAASADMLSVGWVMLRNGRVDLATAQSHIVRPSGGVGKSASVHGLTDTVVGTGLAWTEALDMVITVLTGRVLLVHHAGLDKALLDRMCLRRFGAPLPVPVVDTLALEHRRQRRKHHIEAKQSLRLSDLRDAYNLPRYNAHDCLVDAIATAELLIAMVTKNGGRDATRLRDL